MSIIIAPTELQSLVTTQPDLALLDVRSPVEFTEVHVPQARNHPLNKLNPTALAETGAVKKSQPVYLICRSGARAEIAAEKFARDGFDKIFVVDGGTSAWIEAGLPVERGQSNVIGLERQVRIAAGSLVLTGVMLSYFVHPALIGLSLIG